MRRRLTNGIVLALVCLVAISAGAEKAVHPPIPDTEKLVFAICEKVIDGDTAWFMVIEDGIPITHTVRFLNMDTPETLHPSMEKQPYGDEASAYTTSMLEGKEVWLEYDLQRQDKYDRQLCHIWMPEGWLFNLHLVEEGYASVLYYKPNIRYLKFFQAAEELAINHKRGIWRDPED